MDFSAENYQVKNRLISGEYQAIIRDCSGYYQGILCREDSQARSVFACARQLRPMLLCFSPAWFRVQQQEPPFAAGSSGRLPDQHGLYHISGPAPRGSLLRPVEPAGSYCSFHAVVFPDRAGETSELMGFGLRAHRLAQKRKPSPALASCLAKTRLAPLWAGALCPRSPCRGSAPAKPGRLYYKIGCFPSAAGKLLFLAPPHPAGIRVVFALRLGQDRSRKLALPRRGSLRQPPARSAKPPFSADPPGQPPESSLGETKRGAAVSASPESPGLAPQALLRDSVGTLARPNRIDGLVCP